MKIFLYILCLLYCFAYTPELLAMETTEYTITSGTLSYTPEDNAILLRTAVKIVNTAFTVTADEVDVMLQKSEGESTMFSGDSVETLLFRKNVHFVYKKNPTAKQLVGISERAKYDVQKDMMYMYGKVIVESEGNIIEGDEIAINLITNTVQVYGTPKKPVEVLLKPRTKE